jgi:hypothetical protein
LFALIVAIITFFTATRMHLAAEAEAKQNAVVEETSKRAAAEAAASCNPQTTDIAVCLHL